MPRQDGASSAAGGAPVINVDRKYVRVAEVRPDGFVAFDFAVGEPELYVEMLLTQEAFAEFCRDNAVIELTADKPQADDHDFAWSLRDAADAAARGANPTISSDRMGTP